MPLRKSVFFSTAEIANWIWMNPEVFTRLYALHSIVRTELWVLLTHCVTLCQTHKHYLPILARRGHHSTPDLKGVFELRESHFSDFDSEISLQTFNHLDEKKNTLQEGVDVCRRKENKNINTHLLLSLNQLWVNRGEERRSTIVRNREEPELLQVNPGRQR